MGMYDYVSFTAPDGTRFYAQVKLWACTMHSYDIGNLVPAIVGANNEERRDYSIALREGGYANIVDCHYLSRTESPTQDYVVDKFGDPFDPENFQGLLGPEVYFFVDSVGF